jgi:hypothetical protein
MEENKQKGNKAFAIHNVSCCAVWKTVPTRYLHVTGLYIGKVKVATYCMDGTGSKGDSKKYIVNSPLPTIKNVIGRFETEEECRQACINVGKFFVKQLQHCS